MDNFSGPGFRRHPRTADEMTPELLACVQNCLGAERAGDVDAALEWHRAIPPFDRSRHRQKLMQLASLEGELPHWVWARWIALQALRCEDPGSRTGELHRFTLRHVVESVHAARLDKCFDQGGDPIQVAARVLGESWVFHQVFLHEMGGLVAYLDEFVTGELAERSGLARQWAGAWLRGFRLGEPLAAGRLRLHDAETDEPVEVLDLGVRPSGCPDGWLIGRVVPSGLGGGLMFDMVPMSVPEEVAREVARCRGSAPWGAVTDALDSGLLTEADLIREDYELLGDVMELDLLRFGTRPAELERVTRQLRAGRDEIGRAAYRILVKAADGAALSDADAPYVAAAALNVHAVGEARAKLLRPGQSAAWSRWARLVHEPAETVVAGFAEVTEAAA